MPFGPLFSQRRCVQAAYLEVSRDFAFEAEHNPLREAEVHRCKFFYRYQSLAHEIISNMIIVVTRDSGLVLERLDPEFKLLVPKGPLPALIMYRSALYLVSVLNLNVAIHFPKSLGISFKLPLDNLNN